MLWRRRQAPLGYSIWFVSLVKIIQELWQPILDPNRLLGWFRPMTLSQALWWIVYRRR